MLMAVYRTVVNTSLVCKYINQTTELFVVQKKKKVVLTASDNMWTETTSHHTRLHVTRCTETTCVVLPQGFCVIR